MAHFAEIDADGIVQRVIVVADADTATSTGQEVEQIGANFCGELHGGTWLQTSYNGNLRKNFAGGGYQFDAARQAFIAPQPWDSWLLDEETCRWQPPVAMPTDGKIYQWNEEQTNWIEMTKQD